MLVDASPGSLDRRVVRAQQVTLNPIFLSMFRQAITAAAAEAPLVEMAGYYRLREIATRLLVDDFGLDLGGVVLTFSWDPAAAVLVTRCRSQATPEQVAAMVAGLAQPQSTAAGAHAEC